MNIARHHFNNTVNDQSALLDELKSECTRLGQIDGADVGAQCTQFVIANIVKIYNDLHAGQNGQQTCMDLGVCVPATTGMPRREKRQATTPPMHDPCRTCEIIIGIAKRHFHNNITDQNALKTQLELECQNLAMHGFSAQEVAGCIKVVDDNIVAIFTELKNNPNANPHKICQDFGSCPTSAPPRRQKRQNFDACRTCEVILNLARYHFHNQIHNETTLLRQLLRECDGLGAFEGDNAVTQCKRIVTTNIDQIFADMSTNKSPRQTCQDIKECPTRLAPKRQKRQGLNDCRLCEIILNLARRHFHNNINNKPNFLAELLRECDGLGIFEGDGAVTKCKAIVNTNIDIIFADMSTNKTSRQTCIDCKECQ